MANGSPRASWRRYFAWGRAKSDQPTLDHTCLMKLHQLGNNTAMDFCQPFLTSLVQVTQRILVESQLVQDRRMNVTEVDRLLHSSQADFVRGAVDLAAFDAA